MALLELIQGNPRTAIILISILVTFFMTVVRYFMTDREKMKEIRVRQKELRKEMKNYRDNPEKMLELNKQMMADMPEQLKQSFKPMIITMIPFLILFAWLRSTFALTAIAGTWFWWYLVSAMVFGILLSKLFGLQ